MSRLAIASFAASMLSAGCADNQETLIVLMAPAWTEGECSVDDSSDDALLFGLLDVDFDSPYLMPAIVLNNSAAQSASDNNTGVVSNEIQLRDAKVTIDCPQQPELLDGIDKAALDFKVPLATNSLAPGDAQGVVVEVLPLATVRLLAANMKAQLPVGAKATVRANVTFRGSRTGNDVGKIGVIEARDFSFPIDLCQSCLLTCNGCPEDFEFSTCEYSAFNAAKVPLSGGVCGNGQDFWVVPDGCDVPD